MRLRLKADELCRDIKQQFHLKKKIKLRIGELEPPSVTGGAPYLRRSLWAGGGTTLLILHHFIYGWKCTVHNLEYCTSNVYTNHSGGRYRE